MALKSAAAEPAIPLVDIKSVDPTIVIELRYSGPNISLGARYIRVALQLWCVPKWRRV